jgi:hypothetical protein
MEFYKGFKKTQETKITTSFSTKSDLEKIDEIKERMHGNFEIKKDNNTFDDLQKKINSLNNIKK